MDSRELQLEIGLLRADDSKAHEKVIRIFLSKLYFYHKTADIFSI